MSGICYQDIAEHLRHGREIEFGYRGKLYSITNSSDGYWYFYGDTDGAPLIRLCAFKELEQLPRKLAELCIEGTPVPQIFDQSLYDEDKLCIL